MQFLWDRAGCALTAADGAVARIGAWASVDAAAGPADPSAGTGPRELSDWVQPPLRLGLVLVRRGGYAVGAAERGELTAHHCGTRYVQSRTAAGGWSQQRFARRRGNQSDALVGSVADRAHAMLGGLRLGALVVGGDKALVRQVLADARLATLDALPRREFHDIPDPRFVVLQKVLQRGRAVRLTLTEPSST